MFIETEGTPNPATLKFLPGRDVMGGGTADFASAEAAVQSPLATAVFALPGVARVFLGSDFVTVTKTDAISWQALKPQVLGALMEHFMSGRPVIEGEADPDFDLVEEDVLPEDEEIVAQIRELLDTRVRPAVAGDGGDIVFRGYREGVVRLTARLLLGLPVLARHAEARHREHAAPLSCRRWSRSSGGPVMLDAATRLEASALDTLFREARTHNKFTDEPVSDDTLRELYDILKWGPTSANSSPARFLFLRTRRGEGAPGTGTVVRQPRQDDGGAGDRDRCL